MNLKTLITAEIDQLPSRQFRGYDWSKHPNVHDFMNELFFDYLVWAKEIDGQQRIKHKAQLKEQLTCFVLELFRTYKAHPELSMAVSLGNETISGYQHSRYKPNHFTYKLFVHIFNFLLHDEHIELPLGDKGRPTGASSHQRSTRVRATKSLIDLMKLFGINQYMISSFPTPPECIVLRDRKRKGQKKGDDIEYIDTDFTFQARSHLEEINAFLSQHHLNLELTDEQEAQLLEKMSNRNEQGKLQHLDFNDKQLRRIFNNASFEQGGRFYGGFWQQIPKEYRFLITIDGNRTMQYDYSGMHFAIMYAKKALPMPDGDAYQLEGYDRSLRSEIKKAFNIIINCETVPKAIATIHKEITKGKLSGALGNGEQLLRAFKDKHPLIEEFIASGEGIKLQFIDSQIAELILLKGLDSDVCILPIHDGFITATNNEQLLIQWMEEAYQAVMGTTIAIKPESIYLELIDSHKGIDYSVTDKEKLVHESPTLTGEARSFGSILSVDNVIDPLEHSQRYNSREDEWYLATGTN